MTQETGKINDADLHAYCDGELDEARKNEVEIYLRANPEKAHEVAGWQMQNETLHALYDNIADEPMPANLNPHQIARSSNLWKSAIPRWQSIAAMLALFVTGLTSGWVGHDVVTNTPTTALERPMVRQALAAHTAYAVEVLHPVEVKGSDEQHLVSWLSKRLKIPVKAPKLTQDGFTLVGGRLLPREEGVAAQFMYEDAFGSRVTLYLIRNQMPETSSFRFAKHKNMNAFYWLDDRISYVLVGNVTKKELSPLAHTIYAQLED